MLRRPPLHDSVVGTLRERLRTVSRADARLPSEAQLAADLGVSRPTVREALRILEGEKLVVRRRGVGTFTSAARIVEAGIERLESFWDTIRQAGYRPSARILKLIEASVPDDIAEALGLQAGSRGFRVDTLYFADHHPVLFTEVYVPRAHVTSLRTLAGRRRWTSMREFFHHELKLPAQYSRLTILATGAPRSVARDLALKVAAPVLILEGVTIGEGEEPLMHTRAFFRTDKYRFFLVRR